MGLADQGRPPEPDTRRARLLDAFVSRLRPVDAPPTGRLDIATAELFGAFERERVQALLLKGPALEQALYRPGERRFYVDVDLLVAPRDRAAARRILAELGYADAHQSLGIDDVGGVVHAETWLGRPDSQRTGIVVELHLWLAGATADHQEAWDALSACRGWVELEGQRIPALGRAGLALGLAAHAAQHGPTFAKGLAELELGLERWPEQVWEQAARLAEQVGATEALAAGLRLVSTGETMARALDLPATERIDWEIRNASSRPRGTFHLRAFAQAGSGAARWNIMRRALLPKRAWILTEHPWARQGGWRVPAAYVVHATRAPLWALRAWLFTRRLGRRSRGAGS